MQMATFAGRPNEARSEPRPLDAAAGHRATRLVVVSNRVSLPGEWTTRAGGLAVAMRDALRRSGGLWFGWNGEVEEAPPAEPTVLTRRSTRYATLALSPAE